MKKQVASEDRHDLEAKMASVFGQKIKKLSTELQQILLDDMVTAFENRLNVLKRASVRKQS